MSRDEALLTDDESAILNAIVHGRDAWSSPDQIDESTPFALPLVTALALRALEARGLVESFAHPDCGQLVTLSPLGAARLGVVIEDDGDGVELHWTSEAASARTTRVGRRAAERTEARAELLGQVADPGQPDPGDMLAAMEYFEQLFRTLNGTNDPLDRLPRPYRCVGFTDPIYLPIHEFDVRNPELPPKHYRPIRGKKGLTTFEGGQNLQKGRTCRGCGGGGLDSAECCPRCARTGIDGRIWRLKKAKQAALAAALTAA